MQTVSITEAPEKLRELITKLGPEPVVVMDGDKEIAVISSPTAIREERRKRWDAFMAASESASAELKRSLDRDGITPEEFLTSLLRDEE